MKRRNPRAKMLKAPTTVGPNMQVESIYESDPDGRPVVHHRVVDTIGRMLRNGSITQAMHDAAQDFAATFTIARFDPVVCMALDRIPAQAVSLT